ncbi:hypothetical protein [uncultured Alistipes sp.]|jgi:hypothetical protein|uniref:hypothetical protein n=1 Tax=uncultured Alistipes sp. TaxID=538949 RepID=UPI0025F62B62|nr:hypothetical protein [uncultured Alistipes sp.]
MKRIFFIIGFMFYAALAFAQSECATITEKAMYEKYHTVFDNTGFSTAYWKTPLDNVDIAKRKYDLQILTRRLAEKLGVTNLSAATQLDYLRKEPASRGMMGDMIHDKNSIRAKFYADNQSAYHLQIQVNKAYLEFEKAEVMIAAVAEEVYHACQYNEVQKLIKNQQTSVPKEVAEQWHNDFKSEVYDLLPKRINQLREKESQLKAKNLTNESRFLLEADVKHLNDEIYGSKSIGRKGCLEERYENLQLEKDAKTFGKIMVKVYKDKFSK